MKISLNEIKKYVDIKIPTDELIKLIGARLVEVEGYEDLAPKYEGIYIVKVVECEPIPETHLHLCQIDAGTRGDAAGGTPASELSASAVGETAAAGPRTTIQVVCGAPNVHKGMLAAWIAPGAIVPATYGNENFQLSVRKLRGYDSNGMLAAADELDLGTDHDGIIEIDPKTAKPGDKFADVFGLNDIILDIENKSLTHRPDCFGIIGFAREVSGILGQPFTEPGMFVGSKSPNFTLPDCGGCCRAITAEPHKDGREDCDGKVKLAISIDNDTLCPRYSCAVLDFASLPEKSKYFSPDAVFLAKADMRSIDPIVDMTNIIMLETGQPLHAFDYDKFVSVGGSKTPKIIVRAAKEGEELQLLDGKTIKCHKEDILITSNNVPVALAGAMGGFNTAIDASTKRIILESATFSLYNLRKTQMAHGIFSEAITRFTKGQPAGLTMPVLSETIRRFGVQPLAVADEYPHPKKPETIEVSAEEINALLGTDYSPRVIKDTLANVGLGAEIPFWRTDLHIKEDIIEEVGRLLGYDNIALDFPLRPFVGADLDPLFSKKTALRSILSDKLSAHEALTYSFVSEALQKKVGENPEDSYKIVNSISPELQCFRQTIVPSLLDKLRDNIKAGYTGFSLYEINQVSAKSLGLNAENVPNMENHLGFVILGDYYQAKAVFSQVFPALELKPAQKFAKFPYLEPLHAVSICLDGEEIGALGEIRASVLKQFKLDTPVAVFEINLDKTLNLPSESTKIREISKFPSVSRDVTVTVAENANFSELSSALHSALTGKNLVFSITPVSIYQASDSGKTKNVSFHLVFSSTEKTLGTDEISDIMEEVTKKLEEYGPENPKN